MHGDKNQQKKTNKYDSLNKYSICALYAEVLSADTKMLTVVV